MKPFDPDDPHEVAVAGFFANLTPGWTVERPAPSIERVSCYVLKGGSVIVTEYQGASFNIYISPRGADGIQDHALTLQTLQAMVQPT